MQVKKDKKKSKRKKQKKRETYDNEFEQNQQNSNGSFQENNDPYSFHGNSHHPMQDPPASSRAGGSHKVEKNGKRKKRKTKAKASQFRLESDFNGFD